MAMYAVSVMASRPGQTNHGVFMVEAVSQDEAAGKGMRVCRMAYPPESGWVNHHVVTYPTDNVVSPDGPVTVTTVR